MFDTERRCSGDKGDRNMRMIRQNNSYRGSLSLSVAEEGEDVGGEEGGEDAVEC